MRRLAGHATENADIYCLTWLVLGLPLLATGMSPFMTVLIAASGLYALASFVWAVRVAHQSGKRWREESRWHLGGRRD